MTDKKLDSTSAESPDQFHARKRRERRDAARIKRGQAPIDAGSNNGKQGKRPKSNHKAPPPSDGIYLYGLHTVKAALENPNRQHIALYTSANALKRLQENGLRDFPIEPQEVHPREIDKMLDSDSVHQGVILHCQPLPQPTMNDLASNRLLLILDQVTDPHNVGAIMRSAVAMGAGALITTARHSPSESGVLAKSASGALDMLPYVQVRNLGEVLEQISDMGFQSIGLDSEGPKPLESTFNTDKIALVLGNEGKGLREKTRTLCTDLARLDMPGAIKSLNVSNACALSLYLANTHLNKN
jgi:23S rRNA (guanosine2251-2'-O)-methyltransferase